MVVVNATSSMMFGTSLSTVQSSAVLSHVSDFFLIMIAFCFVWFVLTLIVALTLVNKGKKKGQVLWTFIVSLLLLIIVLIMCYINIGSLLLWIGGL